MPYIFLSSFFILFYPYSRATSASSGYTDDGFDEYADPDEPDQEGAALTVTPHLSPKSYDEESPKGMYSRAPNKTPDSCTSYNDEIPKGMYSGAPNKIPDPYTGYPIGSEQHRIHVQRLHEEAERERRAIEDKLMRLRDVDMVRRKQKEYENMVNSQNQNQNQYVNQRQQQQQQQQQQQYQFHNNHHTNHDNNFQIMDRHTDHIRQPPQHTSSSSKSNNSNYAHERSHDRSHERYDGMIKSDSRSGKIKKLKSVVEIPRRIIKKSTFAYLMRNTFLVHF